jgi:hypothetical protein
LSYPHLIILVPLLESGVASACEIVSHFGISIPWEYKPIIGRDKNIKKEEFSFFSSFIFWISIFSVLCFIFIQMCNIVFI